MRRDKTPLLLMEQLVTLLVFALAAALCLQAFVTADRLSRRMADREQAAIHCQNAAETLKQKAGDIPAALGELGDVGRREGFGYFVSYGEGWSEFVPDGVRTSSYTLRVMPLESGLDGLGKAQVTAYGWDKGEMEELFSLEAAWQEVTADG